MSDKETKKSDDFKFKKGNTIGKETRFKVGHTFSNKYKTEYCEQMLKYFKDEIEEGHYPTFELYAVSIGVVNDTLLNWADAHPQFRHAYEACKSLQKGIMISGTMEGRFNPVFAKFLAVNCHGMVEKSEQKVEGDTNATITVNIHEVN